MLLVISRYFLVRRWQYENYLVLSDCDGSEKNKNTWLYKLNDKNISVDFFMQ